jgi:hypothetical protein
MNRHFDHHDSPSIHDYTRTTVAGHTRQYKGEYKLLDLKITEKPEDVEDYTIFGITFTHVPY